MYAIRSYYVVGIDGTGHTDGRATLASTVTRCERVVGDRFQSVTAVFSTDSNLKAAVRRRRFEAVLAKVAGQNAGHVV